MTIQTTTHLNFRGDARAALDLYGAVFGGHTVINTYADFGRPKDLPGADHVVFGLVASDSGFRVMGYDIPGETGGTIAGGTSTRRENGTTLTDRRCSSPSTPTRSRRPRRTGTSSPTAPPSSSRSLRPHGAPGSACSPTGSVSPGAWGSPPLRERVPAC